MSLWENLLAPGTIERLGWMLVHVLWQATAVAILLAVFLRLLRRASANVRYWTACSALALMVALPLVTIRLMKAPGPVAEAGPVPVTIASPPAGALPAAPATVEVMEELPATASTPASVPLPMADLTIPAVPLPERIVSALEPTLPYVVLGWLVGVFGLSAWHLGGWTQLQRLKRRMVREIGTPLQHRLQELSTRLGVHRAVGLLESALVEVPTVVGWLRPVILLPASALTGLSVEQLEAILAHELAHIRRYDYLVNLVQTVVEILGFYHPATWWVSHRIRIERENCCDDLAVQVCGSSLQYARALACMEEIRHNSGDLALAATGGSLMARIARLLGRPTADDRRFAWLPGLVALFLVAGLIIPTALVLGTSQPAQAVVPATAPAASPDHNLTEPNGAPGNAEGSHAVADDQTAQILLEFRIARVFDDAYVDPATVLQMADALGSESLLAREISEPGQKLDLTVGRILRRYVASRPLGERAGEAVLRLFQSQSSATMLSAPRVLTRDGVPANARIIDERWLRGPDPSARLERIEFGTVLNTTCHVLDAQRVILKMKAEISDLEPGSDPNQPIVLRTSAQTNVTAWDNRYLIWAAIEPTAAPAGQEANPRSSVYLMVKPRINLSPTAQTGRDQEVVYLPARQVLLDVRTVTVNHDAFAALGVDWKQPSMKAGILPTNPTAPHAGLRGTQIGHVPDLPATDVLLTALNLLQKEGQAKIASQQILTQELYRSQIKVLKEEWSTRTEPRKTETGTIVTIKPHVAPNNVILLELGVDVTRRLPTPPGSDLPLLTKRTSQSTVMVKDGGTVAVSGISEDQPGSTSRQDTVIFVTARLMDDVNEPSLQTRPAAGPDLRPQPAASLSGGQTGTEAVQAQGNLRTRAEADRTNRISELMARAKTCWKQQQYEAALGQLEALLAIDPGNDEALTLRQMVQDMVYLRRQTELDQHTRPAANLSSERLVLMRQEYVNSDPMVQEWSRQIVALERDLIVAQQTRTPTHPDVVRSQTQLEAMKKRLQEKHSQLEQEFDEGLTQRAEKRTGSNPERRQEATITATFADTDLRNALAEIAQRTGVKITPDATVKPTPVTVKLADASLDAALRQVLKSTAYTSKKIDHGAYQVFRPLTFTFTGTDLVKALRDLWANAGVPIVVDPNLQGDVNVSFENLPLDHALQLMVAGRPVVVKKMRDYYLVAGRGLTSSPPWQGISETRRIRLSYRQPAPVKELLSPVFAPYVQIEEPNPRDPNSQGHTLLITAAPAIAERIVADIRRIDRPKRQVLLDARVVSMERGNLLNLSTRWNWPTVQAGVFTSQGVVSPTGTSGSEWPYGVQIGYAPDQTFTNALVTALNLLVENKQADIIANPKVVALDGRRAEMKAVQEQWFMMTAPDPNSFVNDARLGKIESGTVLTITPYVGDNNDITLRMAVEVSDRIPKAPGSDLPLVRRRTAKNEVTVKDGGTVAVAGLTENRGKTQANRTSFLGDIPLVGELFKDRNNDKPTREVAVFVTAHLVAEAAGTSVPTLPSVQTAAPPVSKATATNTNPQDMSLETAETRRIRLNYTQPARAKQLLSPVFVPYVQVEEPNPRDSNSQGNTLLITAAPALADRIVAGIKQIDRLRQQVLLDARVVSIAKDSRSNLGVDWNWGWPPTADGATAGPKPYRVQFGSASDQMSTKTLMMALTRLEEDRRAQILANPKVLTRDGRWVDMRHFQDRWDLVPRPAQSDTFYMVTKLEKTEPGTAMSVTPHIEDNNDITLRLAVEVTDRIPKAIGSELPLVTRRTAKNEVTVKDGGTVAVAGVTVDGVELKDKPGREVAVFVTAHLVSETSQASAQPAAFVEPKAQVQKADQQHKDK